VSHGYDRMVHLIVQCSKPERAGGTRWTIMPLWHRGRVALESAIEIQACLLLTQVRPKSSEVAACCLVNWPQRTLL
jgi:hypothetical protein